MELRTWLTISMVLLCVLSWHSHGFAADKITNCSANQEAALQNANEYISDHLNNFLATKAGFLPTKYKDKLKKNWPKTTLKCSNADDYCAKKGFAAFQNVGKVLRYCTKEFDLTTASLCRVAALTMHELGHSAGIPIHARHNHADLYGSVASGDADLVYRLGNEFRSYCDNNPGTSPSVTQASGGPIGATCQKNEDCRSKKCQGTGSVRECVCAKDGDCGSAARCKKRLGKNYCLAKGTGPGDFCKKNSDCHIGVCQKKSCVCKTDDHCRSFYVGITDIRCVNRVGKNFCQETNQDLGESCQKDSDCRGSLKCKKKQCSS
ncbi:MAG: hypothetical protein MRJ96_09590 [Nitrospirales bacterium]|nr:hypothetical protein [Nitrospira sp.]MDR4501687.1 hypothetical protein [Nitrospirales bacterium]